MDIKTADEYRAEADACEREYRSTAMNRDNFVSRNAMRTMAGRYRELARFVENGQRTEARTLFLNGEVASTMQREGQYGMYWILNDTAAAAFGKRFFSPSKARKGLAVDRTKGFTEGEVLVAGMINGRTMLVEPDMRLLALGEYEILTIDVFAGRDSIRDEAAA